MSGFVGICSFKKILSNEQEITKEMNLKLQKKESENDGYFFDKNINLGYREIKIDKENEKQPMSIKLNEITYTIVFNGRIYNKNEIKDELEGLGYYFEGCSDQEILLKTYIEFGPQMVKKINGVFSFGIWNDKKKELLLARDHFGIKPLFYTLINDTLIFSTEIKAILCYPVVTAKINNEGIGELFGHRTCSYTRMYNI